MATEIPDIDPRWQHRMSVDTYHQMVDARILTEDDKVELLEGILVQMSPQEPPHAWVIRYLNRLFVRALGDAYDVRPQLPLTLARSEPEPDLAVADATRTWRRHPETAFLVVEVSGASLRRDRDVKAALYAEAQVGEYWIVDVDNRSVLVLTDPDVEARRYRSLRTLAAGDRLRASSLPDVELPIAALFDGT